MDHFGLPVTFSSVPVQRMWLHLFGDRWWAIGCRRCLAIVIWEEVCHSYTEAADAGDVVVGKRKSPKGNISNEHQRQ